MAGDMHKEKIVGTTVSGKKVAYKVLEGEALRTIYFVGGGKLPPCLEGKWSDVRQIEKVIEVYLSREEPLISPELKKEKDHKKAVSAAKNRPSKLKQPIKEK